MEAQLGGGPGGGVLAADPGADGGADGGGVPRAGPAWRCTAEVLILIAVKLSDMLDSPLRLLRKFDMKRVATLPRRPVVCSTESSDKPTPDARVSRLSVERDEKSESRRMDPLTESRAALLRPRRASRCIQMLAITLPTSGMRLIRRIVASCCAIRCGCL